MCHGYDYATENLSERGDLRVEDLDELLPSADRATDTGHGTGTESEPEPESDPESDPVTSSADD